MRVPVAPVRPQFTVSVTYTADLIALTPLLDAAMDCGELTSAANEGPRKLSTQITVSARVDAD